MSRFSSFLANFRTRYTAVWWQSPWSDCYKNAFLRTSDRIYVPKKSLLKKSFFWSSKIFVQTFSKKYWIFVDFLLIFLTFYWFSLLPSKENQYKINENPVFFENVWTTFSKIKKPFFQRIFLRHTSCLKSSKMKFYRNPTTDFVTRLPYIVFGNLQKMRKIPMVWDILQWVLSYEAVVVKVRRSGIFRGFA